MHKVIGLAALAALSLLLLGVVANGTAKGLELADASVGGAELASVTSAHGGTTTKDGKSETGGGVGTDVKIVLKIPPGIEKNFPSGALPPIPSGKIPSGILKHFPSTRSLTFQVKSGPTIDLDIIIGNEDPYENQ